MTALREHRETMRYLSFRKIVQERTELFKVINGDAFFPIKTLQEDMRETFWQKPIGDVGTFKLMLFGLGNGCPPNLMLRWILSSQTWSPAARKSTKKGTTNRLHFKQGGRKKNSVVLFRPGSSEASVLKRTIETLKQSRTVKPST